MIFNRFKIAAWNIQSANDKLATWDIQSANDKITIWDIQSANDKLAIWDIQSANDKIAIWDIHSANDKLAIWDIQSANDKLSEENVEKMLHNYGYIFLSEIKTSLKISCTGFTVFQNSAKHGHRGGIAPLIQPCIAKCIRNFDKSYTNIISFELEFMTDIVFVGCYILPGDSPYYDAAMFGYKFDKKRPK